MNCRSSYSEFLPPSDASRIDYTPQSMVDARSRVRLVEPKTLMPDRFGKKNGSSSGELRRRGARGAEAGGEGRRESEATDHCDTPSARIQREKRDGPRIATFLISRTEGEAVEIVRGAEREPGLEQWPRLAALYDPLAAGRSLDDSRQILSPPKAAQIDDLSHTPSLGKFGITSPRAHWRPVA